MWMVLSNSLCVCVALRPTRTMASSFKRFLDHTTTHHSLQDSSGRVISSSQRPLPDNTQYSQQTDVDGPVGIRTHNHSRRAAVDLHLRQHGYWDRLLILFREASRRDLPPFGSLCGAICFVTDIRGSLQVQSSEVRISFILDMSTREDQNPSLTRHFSKNPTYTSQKPKRAKIQTKPQ